MSAPRILLVEDELITAKDIQNKLVRMGYEVVATISTGEEAIEQVPYLRPDLVLMDIYLSGKVDGIDAAAQICENMDVPVIYLTASSNEETLQRAQSTDPFGYILKPVQTRELLVTIKIALYKHSIEKDLRRQLQHTNAIRLIDQAIISNNNLQQTLNEVLEQIKLNLSVDAAAILLVNPHSQTLQYVSGVGFQVDPAEQVYIQMGQGYAGRAAQTGEQVFIPDLMAEPELGYPFWIARENFLAYFAIPLICKNQTKGVLEMFQREKREVDPDWLSFLEILSTQTAIAIDNASMREELLTANMELTQAYNATIEGWSAALELRNLETEGHSRRVTEMTVILARTMGVPAKDLAHMRRGALLHDIGKMGIPDTILLKPASLSPAEWEIMRRHPTYAFQLLSLIPFLRPALEIPYCHHERWDGTGYPRGLQGDEIPLSARIFAVVDVWDALRSRRPYHEASPEDVVLEYIQEQSGKLFDPTVVDAFLRLRKTPLGVSDVLGGKVGVEAG